MTELAHHETPVRASTSRHSAWKEVLDRRWYIRRLGVTVDHPPLVGGRGGPRQRGHQLGGPPRGPGGAEQLLREAPPLDELHREEGQAAAVAHVEDLHDVRMPEARHRLGLAG